jgi:hypothetical protein
MYHEGGYTGRRTGVTKVTFTRGGSGVAAAQKSARKARIYAARNMSAGYAIRGSLGRSSRAELKGFDISNAAGAAALNTWGSIASAEPGAAFLGMTELNDIGQGSTFYNRVGAKVCMTSLVVRFSLMQLTTPITGSVRYAIVYDKQCNGTFPAITDIFGVNGPNAGNNAGVNLTNRARFTVLRDKTVNIDPAQQLVFDVEEYCKLPQLEAEFKTSGGTIGDLSSGAIYFMAGLIAANGAGTIGLGNLQTRVRYLD